MIIKTVKLSSDLYWFSSFICGFWAYRYVFVADTSQMSDWSL